MTFEPKSLAQQQLEEWPTDLNERMGHFSPAKLKQFRRCPEQFRRRYILDESEPPAQAIVWGRADHQAHEQNFRQKIESHEDLPAGDVEQLFAAAFETEVSKAGGAGEIEWGNEYEGKTAKKAHAHTKDRGVELTGLYAREASPRIQPTHIERELEVEIPGVPVPIQGRIDLQGEVEPTGFSFSFAAWESRIIDRKTAGRNVFDGANRMQGYMYQLMLALIGEPPPTFDLHLSIKGKVGAAGGTGTPKVVIGEHTVEAPPVPMLVMIVRQTMIDIAKAWTLYGPEHPWPDALTHQWACDYCGFRDPKLTDIEPCAWWTPAAWNGQ